MKAADSQPLVLPLRECATSSSLLVGTKALNLARLAMAGFAVPDAIVLTSEAFSRWFALIGGSAERGEASLVPIPAVVRLALFETLGALGGGPWAVRSSSPSEDLGDSSFAGQYETTLDVREPDEVLAAVVRSWRSALEARVLAYSGSQAEGPAPMPVLIQEMVPAAAAGVAFTADPVSGDRTVTLVSAVKGLGERLVSGAATPDEWVVRAGDAVLRSGSEEAITSAAALAVAGLAMRVEAQLGYPVDIEWASAAGELYLLQARPITGLPASRDGASRASASLVVPPPGHWQRDQSHFPRPCSPMNDSTAIPLANAGLRHTFTEFGLMAETLEIRRIGGWNYNRLVPLGGRDKQPPPKALLWLLARIHPQLRKRVKLAERMVSGGGAISLVREWRDVARPELEQNITELRSRDLGSLSSSELEAHLLDCQALLTRGFRTHYMLHGAHVVAIGGLIFRCRELLGWDDQTSISLLTGLSTTSTAPGVRLDELTRLALAKPGVRDALTGSGPRPDADQLSELDSEFGRAFAEYLAEYAGRIFGYDLADPTLAEDPSRLLGLLVERMPAVDSSTASAMTERRERAVAAARHALAGRRGGEQEIFEYALALAKETYPTREENVFYTVSVPMALLRYALCEVGRRLVADKRVDTFSDVFFLELPEALQSLDRGMDQHEMVAARRLEYSRAVVNSAPVAYGEDPGAPAFSALPKDSRFLHEAFQWYTDSIFGLGGSGGTSSDEPGTVRGVGASPGVYCGRVRNLRDENDMDSVRDGEILVTPTTSPAWSVIFQRVGALVTDSGGMLSHPAIIAREYGVPAVVATGNATSVLRTGQLVTVDGTTGVIRDTLPH